MGVTPMSPKTKNLSKALGRSPKLRCHLQTDVTSGTSGGCSAGVGERLIDFCCAGTAVKTEPGSLADIKAPPWPSLFTLLGRGRGGWRQHS